MSSSVSDRLPFSQNFRRVSVFARIFSLLICLSTGKFEVKILLVDLCVRDRTPVLLFDLYLKILDDRL